MIIETINGLEIDSSLLKHINLECIRSRCIHRGCCCESTQLTDSDIQKIDAALPQILPYLPSEVSEFISSSKRYGYYDIDKKLRAVSKTGQDWSTCIFNVDNTCLLDQFKVTPIFCRSYPVIIENNVLKLNLSLDLDCLSGDEYAYKLLKDEIILITSKEFYGTLYELLSKAESRGLYFMR